MKNGVNHAKFFLFLSLLVPERAARYTEELRRPASHASESPHLQELLLRQLLWLGAQRVGLSMDESDQLHPEQSTTALVALHSKARYFSA